jgi:S-methylmethionine-dependent homocysteine/selenocysteine methylase
MAGPLTLLDGAVGTELARRGVDARGPLFGAQALLDPRGRALLGEIHREYLSAGARVITAATFRTNLRAVLGSGVSGARFPALAEAAVRVALEAAAGRARVAGSVAPVADCYRPALSPPRSVALREHGETARALAAAGCDLLLVETVCAAEEGLAAVEACAATGLEVWVAAMAAPPASGRGAASSSDASGLGAPVLLDGGDLAAFFRRARDAGARAALINCTPCDGIDFALPAAAGSGLPWGAYAHMGEIDPALAWPASPVLAPEAYRARAAAWIAGGATLVGGCCGTTPAHIRALARLADGPQPT